MRPPCFSSLVSRIRAEHLCRELLQLAFALAVVVMLAGQTVTYAGDIFRTAPTSGAKGGGMAADVEGTATPLGSTIDTAALQQQRAKAALDLQRRAADALKRTDSAIRAVTVAQRAARDAAAALTRARPDLSSVPDGLQPGGLEPLDLTAMERWKGAATPTPVEGKANDIVIVQTEQTALLNWKTFNIGNSTTLTFDQSKGGTTASQWIAFNHVHDSSAKPSQILGKLRTIGAGASDAKGDKPVGGQVYVLNPNGIIFGGASQVNVHALVASTLPINERLVAQGLLDNDAHEFLFSASELNKQGEGTLARSYGTVVVQEGAQLTAPTSADHVGGRIALFGSSVTNAGSLSTPDGQTILAAGLQIGVAAHKSDDPTLRGLDVYVGAVGAAGEGRGTVTNTGVVDVPRGNATMAGRTVDQLGVIDSTTSVAYNGRIDLDASYAAVSNPEPAAGVLPFFATKNGTVTLGRDSVTRILPEWASTEKVVGTKLALLSQVNLRGLNIHFEENASLWAPAAKVTIDAGRAILLTKDNKSAQFVFEDTPLDAEGKPTVGGQIYLDAGATIDVSGTPGLVDAEKGRGAVASVSDNVIKVELRGAEFANSPVQRDGELRGETVSIDIRKHGEWDPTLNEGKGAYKWIGTPLGDMSGYVGLVQRSVGQLTTEGGSVAMNAGGAVVIQKGASVDVSGGFTTYNAGEVRTTRILDDGRIIDISNATPDRKYDGIYTGLTTKTDPKWGTIDSKPGSVAESFSEAGYTEGAAGGSLAITATSMALDGALRGQVVAGERQRAALPAAGALALSFKSQYLTQTTFGTDVYSHEVFAPKVIFQPRPKQVAAGAFGLDAAGYAAALPEARRDELQLPTTLFGAEGFGSLRIVNGGGDISVPWEGPATALEGEAPPEPGLHGEPGGALSFEAANITIEASVSAPGGNLEFKVYNYSPIAQALRKGPEQNPLPPAPATGRGAFVLGAKAYLDTAGLVVDDRTVAGTIQPLNTAGGGVSVQGYMIDLRQGSVIDVSGGVAVGATGKFTYGKGGRIAIEGSQDLTYQELAGGTLALGSELRGFSGTTGAKLSIKAPSIQIGGTTQRATTLLLQPTFFSTGGFGAYSLTGIGEALPTPYEFAPGILIEGGTVIEAKQLSRLATVGATSIGWYVDELPAALRSPVSLAFSATGLIDGYSSARLNPEGLVVRGDLKVGAGARIETDAKGSVALSGDTVAVAGAIIAPAGTLTIAGAKDPKILFANQSAVAIPTVTLGAYSELSTKGAVVLQPRDARGYQTGTAHGGGVIEVSGNIVAERGASLDVSGVTGIVDRLPVYSGQTGTGDRLLAAPGLVPTTVQSTGGTIKLKGAQLLLTDATLLGQSGGASASGGAIEFSSGQYIAPSDTTSYVDPLDVTIRVRQSALPAGLFQQFLGAGASGAQLPNGGGFVTADRLSAGGFDRIALKGTVSFEGPVALAAKGTLAVGDSGVQGSVLYTDAAVELSAPYVRLGKPFVEPHVLAANEGLNEVIINGSATSFPFDPSYGPGSLTVKAGELIDVGYLSLQNTGNLKLVVGTGEVRGSGTLDVAGHISIAAGQVYPPTGSVFTITAADFLADPKAAKRQPGTVTFLQGKSRALPLSAGGTLNIYASQISQGGTLRAPIGTINLGWDGTGTAPKGYVTAKSVPVTTLAVLESGSTTSVSALDPATGKDLTIPYGVVLNGLAWIDPRGVDVTNGGLPQKRVNLSAQQLEHQIGATLDLRGGGDLYAYRWVGGNGGRDDILASTTSFAVIPTYSAAFAPYAPYMPEASGTLDKDRGYVNDALKVGDRVHLEASAALPAGEYTLLPARYALLPGAVLVTPKTGVPLEAPLVTPEGASLVSGYRYNSLDATRTDAPLRAAFEVAPQKVVEARAQYDDYSASKFFTENAAARDVVAPRLPFDAGQLVLTASEQMLLRGAVSAQGATGGRGGLVDIAALGEIVVRGSGTASAGKALVLSAADLSTFKAESLLIGGVRRSTDAGTAVAVTADSVILDNAGTALAGADIALVAAKRIELAAGSELRSTGTLAETDPLLFGDSAVAGSGNGVLVRVSADAQASSVRRGVAVPVASEVTPTLVVGAGAMLGGASGVLDSSQATQLDSTARLQTDSLALSSGRIGLVLNEAGDVKTNGSLLLAGGALDTLQQASGTLSLQGYSSIDLFGHGQVGVLDAAGRPVVAGLELHTAAIRGFNTGGASVTLAAKNVLIDNVAHGAAGSAAATGLGTLVAKADTLRLGEGSVAVRGFAAVEVDAAKAVVGTDAGGLAVAGDLALRTPLLTASTAADVVIGATGELKAGSVGVAGTTAETGLGARLALTGAKVSTAGTILLPSGRISLRATEGDLAVGGRLDVSGTAKTFVDVLKYTDAGGITLQSDAGSVALTKDAVVSVAAAAGGGDAGTLGIVAPKSVLKLPMREKAVLADAGAEPESNVLAGVILGQAGTNGAGGTFNLDVGATDGASFAALQTALNGGGFTDARSARVRTGAVEISGEAKAHAYKVSADGGSITVTGKIDASGIRGGAIDLLASGSVVLEAGSELTGAAKEFDAAGKGGRVSLEAGAYLNGVSDPNAEVAIRSGSAINLSVAATPATMKDIEGKPIDLGQRSGTLHLRAPQTGEGAEVQVARIDGTIKEASSIVVEAYKVFDLTEANQAASKAITTTTESAVKANGTALGDNTQAITDRLLAGKPAMIDVFHLQPGAEIVNRAGDLTLDHAWDLSTYRIGPNVDAAVAGSGEPGTLTLRAAGDLVFSYNSSTKTLGSLSDGFTGGTAARGGLVDQALLPVGARSWSYRLVAGADFAEADFRSVVSADRTKGSIAIGVGAPTLPTTGTNNNRYLTTGSNMIPARYQTIRTGTGTIDLAAAYDVRLLNNVATIYTAGQQVAAPVGFDVPTLSFPGLLQGGLYGYNQSPPAVQYAMAGGNVAIEAGHDIAHFVEKKGSGKTVLEADSSKELPSNWLYRRGLVDPETGRFITRQDTPAGEVMSTTWWIDYSNFYEGVAALGGGNVSLVAGNDIANVDVAVATNAWMSGRDAAGEVAKPDANALVELGGGDLTLRAGRDVDGGVYYVERGRGTLAAGGEIRTNQTRSTVLPKEVSSLSRYQSTWLPTTLFLGKGSFAVEAGGDLLLGPVANPFLLPSGTNNAFYNRTYFSTYAADSGVVLASLTGDLALHNRSVVAVGDLGAWYTNILAYTDDQGSPTHAMTLPWLRLAQINSAAGKVGAFDRAYGLMPTQVGATAFGGDVTITGRLDLMPSAAGQLDLVAAGSVVGFKYVSNDANSKLPVWASSSVNLSDADPSRFPSIIAPLAGAGPAPTNRAYFGIGANAMDGFDALLDETGASDGSLQEKRALHASDLLHAASTEPVRVYALGGDISGLTLYSSKQTKVIAGNDIADVALYLQNNNSDDVSVVSAGRDIVAYSPNSLLRTQALNSGGPFYNYLAGGAPGPATGAPTAGDIQVSGPGTVEVLAGRNLDLGIGPNVSGGTGLGLTSIGNARNLALPEAGADIVALAGIDRNWALRGDQVEPATAAQLGAANGLAHSSLDFAAFTAAFLDPATAGGQAARYLPVLGTKMGLATTGVPEIWTAYSALPAERRAQFALAVYFAVLRDAGRDYNDPKSPVYRDKEYPNGYAAIAKLFPGNLWQGDIALTSREIKTVNGGEISLFAPGGGLTVGFDVRGTQPLDQGILTERGGGISIFTHNSVIVGTSRIFTLRGGDEVIWSSVGDIAAGSSSKTVQSAPPTRVLIDPQSGDVKTDLAGLATGGGIGVLATVKGVKPGDIDLIAPTGTIDAGDAGIRSTGNLNIASLHVANAANIATGGASAGVPAATTPSLGGVAAAATGSTTTSNKTTAVADTSTTERSVMKSRELPSLIEVVVTSYGGDDKDETEEEEKAKQEKEKPEKEGYSDSAKGAPAAVAAAAPAPPQG